MNWSDLNLIVRKKVHLACCVLSILIEPCAAPRETPKNLCLFRLFLRPLHLSSNVQYPSNLPATNSLYICSLSASLLSDRSSAPPERTRQDSENVSKRNRTMFFSHQSEVSLIMVSCCDQCDHLNAYCLDHRSIQNGNNHLPAAFPPIIFCSSFCALFSWLLQPIQANVSVSLLRLSAPIRFRAHFYRRTKRTLDYDYYRIKKYSNIRLDCSRYFSLKQNCLAFDAWDFWRIIIYLIKNTLEMRFLVTALWCVAVAMHFEMHIRWECTTQYFYASHWKWHVSCLQWHSRNLTWFNKTSNRKGFVYSILPICSKRVTLYSK